VIEGLSEIVGVTVGVRVFVGVRVGVTVFVGVRVGVTVFVGVGVGLAIVDVVMNSHKLASTIFITKLFS
jgi:hypothetical protein